MNLFARPCFVRNFLQVVRCGVAFLFLISSQNSNAAEPRTAALVPGITIKRLPVDLINVNSVAYGFDGRLYAAAYDGKIHVLTDTDGDGIEDQATVYWENPGDLLTPVGMVAASEGLYLAVRGKIALIKDTDGDGKADSSEAVVSGWKKESYNSDRRNDASGITLDAVGNLYFSLGCMSYNKAWMLDGKGKSHYRQGDERGAILKVSPDRKEREIFATGLRFVIGMEFNRHGDLFATDQEGDTWFPGGNPRDELLHIIPDRHYGFPFRHNKYLPDVVDEPEVVGYSPQHQSTCGFRFNEARADRKPFGPAHWEGDALVTGFSRGKLWRTPLAKTRAGYVGRQVQIAAFESLLTDVAISPQGDLLVTCHGGAPDWGSGPAATGHLYKVLYNADAPQPVASWSASPLEIKVAFDRPIDPSQLQLPQIEMGEFVWEGHRHEWIVPGYEVVRAEKSALRHPLKVHGVQVSDDGRTATFTTAPQAWKARYGISLGGVANEKSEPATIELSHDFGGVTAEWKAEGDAESTWRGWLPHIDLNVVRSMMRGSAEHETLFALLEQPGQLTLRSQLLLPGRETTFRWQGTSDFQIQCADENVQSQDGQAEFSIRAAVANEKPIEARGGREEVLPTTFVNLEIKIQTGSPELSFDVSYHADFDPHERPLRLENLLVPWAPNLPPLKPQSAQRWTTTELSGDPERGREIFFGAEGNCALCHSFDGKGGKVGADLTVSVHRGAEAVLQDIIKPSASINPEYVSYTVATRDGKNFVGLFLSADDKEITLIDVAAKTHTVQRDQIDSIKALPVSLMPRGFENLGEEKLQDLVAFLCTGGSGGGDRPLRAPVGGILREYWLDLPKSGLSTLTKHNNFPNKPSGKEVVKAFEGPVNWKESYGTRIRGYVYPPKTGDYVFEMAADDHAELWLSSSEKPDDKKRIIALHRWTPSRVWDQYPEQKSAKVHLEAGQRYYIEALHVEASVDDCLAVGWKLPDGTVERPIPGKRLSVPGVSTETDK